MAEEVEPVWPGTSSDDSRLVVPDQPTFLLPTGTAGGVTVAREAPPQNFIQQQMAIQRAAEAMPTQRNDNDINDNAAQIQQYDNIHPANAAAAAVGDAFVMEEVQSAAAALIVPSSVGVSGPSSSISSAFSSSVTALPSASSSSAAISSSSVSSTTADSRRGSTVMMSDSMLFGDDSIMMGDDSSSSVSAVQSASKRPRRASEIVRDASAAAAVGPSSASASAAVSSSKDRIATLERLIREKERSLQAKVADKERDAALVRDALRILKAGMRDEGENETDGPARLSEATLQTIFSSQSSSLFTAGGLGSSLSGGSGMKVRPRLSFVMQRSVEMIDNGLRSVARMRRFLNLSLDSLNSLALYFSNRGNNARAMHYLIQAEQLYYASHPSAEESMPPVSSAGKSQSRLDITNDNNDDDDSKQKSEDELMMTQEQHSSSSLKMMEQTAVLSRCSCEICLEQRNLHRIKTEVRELEKKVRSAMFTEVKQEDREEIVETAVIDTVGLKSECDLIFDGDFAEIERLMVQTLFFTSQLHLFDGDKDRSWDYIFQTFQRQLRTFGKSKRDALVKAKQEQAERNAQDTTGIVDDEEDDDEFDNVPDIMRGSGDPLGIGSSTAPVPASYLETDVSAVRDGGGGQGGSDPVGGTEDRDDDDDGDGDARSLEEDGFDWKDWCKNGIDLCEYHMQEKQFRMALHIIDSVLSVFDEFVELTDAFKNEGRKHKDPTLSQKLVDLRELEAQLHYCAGKVNLLILKELYHCQTEINNVRAEAEAEADPDDHTDVDDRKEVEMQMRQVHDRYAFNNKCELIDIQWTDKPKMLELRMSFDNGKVYFLPAKKHFDQSLKFYKFDQGFAMTHTEVCQCLSSIYKYLSIFLNPNRKCDTLCKMHKRRISLLSPIEKELNPSVYLETSKELCFEIAQCWDEMGSLRKNELESLERARNLEQRRLARLEESSEEKQPGGPPTAAAESTTLVSDKDDTSSTLSGQSRSEDDGRVTTAATDARPLAGFITDAEFYRKMKRMNYLFDKSVTYFVRFIAYIEFPDGHDHVSDCYRDESSVKVGGGSSSSKTKRSNQQKNMQSLSDNNGNEYNDDYDHYSLSSSISKDQMNAFERRKLVNREDWTLPSFDKVSTNVSKDSRLDFLTAHFQIAKIYNSMHYADPSQQYKATATSMHRYDLIVRYYDQYGPIEGFERQYEISRQLRDLLPVKLNAMKP